MTNYLHNFFPLSESSSGILLGLSIEHLKGRTGSAALLEQELPRIPKKKTRVPALTGLQRFASGDDAEGAVKKHVLNHSRETTGWAH